MLFDAGQLAEARELYLRAVRQDPSARTAYAGLGRLAVREGKLEEAATLFASAESAGSPTNSDAVLGLGHALAEAGWYEEAVAMYTRAIQLDAGSAAAHYGRGNMMAAGRKWPEAVTDFAEASRLARRRLPTDSLWPMP